MELAVRVVLHAIPEAEVAQREVEQVVLADDALLPRVALRVSARAHHAAVVDEVLLDPLVRALAVDDLTAHLEVNRAGQARLRVDALVVVELVGVGADRQAADLQNHLIAAGGVHRACRDHHLRARHGGHRVDVLLVVDLLVRLLRAARLVKERLAARLVPEAQIRLGALRGHADVVALVLPAQLAVVAHHVVRVRMALHGHVAVGMVGVVVVEAHREVAAELLIRLLAQQRRAHRLHEGEERRLELVAVHLRDDGDLHRNHVKHPRAVAHLPRQVAQLVDVEAAPDALQIHRTAAQRPRAERREDRRQLAEGNHLHVLRLVRGDVQVERAAADELPAHVDGVFKVHIVVAAHHQVVGQVLARAEVAHKAILEVQRRRARGDVHPDAHVIAGGKLRAERAAADDQHAVLRRQTRAQRVDLRGVVQTRIAVAVAAAVEQHRVDIPVLGQVGAQHLGERLRVLDQRLRVHNGVAHARADLMQHIDQRGGVRAGVRVDADIFALGEQRGNAPGYGDDAAHRGNAGNNNLVDRIVIDVRVGMEHEAHGELLLCSFGFARHVVPDEADDGAGQQEGFAQHAPERAVQRHVH